MTGESDRMFAFALKIDVDCEIVPVALLANLHHSYTINHAGCPCKLKQEEDQREGHDGHSTHKRVCNDCVFYVIAMSCRKKLSNTDDDHHSGLTRKVSQAAKRKSQATQEKEKEKNHRDDTKRHTYHHPKQNSVHSIRKAVS